MKSIRVDDVQVRDNRVVVVRMGKHAVEVSIPDDGDLGPIKASLNSHAFDEDETGLALAVVRRLVANKSNVSDIRKSDMRGMRRQWSVDRGAFAR